MFGVWSKDPLRSIGACFPIVSAVGILHVWRRIGWSTEGSLWGLLPIAASGVMALQYLSVCLSVFPRTHVTRHTFLAIAAAPLHESGG